jgi:hypothetical protein
MEIWKTVKNENDNGRVEVSYKRTVKDINGIEFDVQDGGRDVSLDDLNAEMQTRLDQIASMNKAVEQLQIEIDAVTQALSG